MTETFNKIVRNSFFRAIVEGTKIVSNVVLVVVLARWLGPSEYGRLSYVLAIMAFVSVGLNLGLPLTFVREGAKREGFLSENIATGLGLQGITTILMLAVLLIAGKIFPELHSDLRLLLLALVYTSLGVIINFFFSFFQAVQRMHLEAVGVITQGVLTVIFALAFLAWHRNADAAMAGYVIALAISTLVSGWLVKRFLFSWRWRFDWSAGRALLKKSWPLMASMAFGGIYNSLDSVMLKIYRGNEAVGIYGAQYRIIYVFFIFSGWYIYSIFPVLSSSFVHLNEQFKSLLARSVQNMAAFAMLFGLTITLLAHQIMFYLYGQAYLSGTLTLQISIWSTMIALVGTVFYFSLVAIEKQAQVMWSMAVGTILNAAMNMMLIPRLGMEGAAISTVVAQAVQLIMNWHSLNKISPARYGALAGKPVVLAVPIMVIYFVLRYFIPTPIAAALSMVVYILALLKTHIFEPQEIKRAFTGLVRKGS